MDTPNLKKAIQFTGERLIPKYNEGTAFYYEHIIRYLFSAQYTNNKIVLDSGCGTGYGSYLISKYGKSKLVHAIDISPEAIEYAKTVYSGNNIRYVIDTVLELRTIANKSIDVVVNFEVIEHIKEQDIFLTQIKRVLKRNGILIVSTPNTFTYPKGNAFHLKELQPQEFSALLHKYFQNVELLSQNYYLSQEINPLPLEKETISLKTKSNFVEQEMKNLKSSKDIKNSEYLIAICSDKKIEKPTALSISLDKVDSFDLTQGHISLSKQIRSIVSENIIMKEELAKMRHEIFELGNQGKYAESIAIHDHVSGKYDARILKMRNNYSKMKLKMKYISKIFFRLFFPLEYFIFVSCFFMVSKILSFLVKPFARPLSIPVENQVLNGVSFIIPTWNKKEYVIACIQRLDQFLSQEKTNIQKEIIVIDNGSHDGSVEAIQKLKTKIPLILIQKNTNIGFARAINLGLSQSRYNYIYTINNDMEVQEHFFDSIIERAKNILSLNRSFFGIASQIIFYDPAKRREESGKTYMLPNLGYISVSHYVHDQTLLNSSYTLYPGGGSSLMNKYIFQHIGGYDGNSYTPLYDEDLDLGFIAWKLGYPSYFEPKSIVLHHHRTSSSHLAKDPSYYMYKNFLVFILKNTDSVRSIFSHIFLYPIWIILYTKHSEYAISAIKNIKNIFLAKIRLYKYKTQYHDNEILNFPLFESKLS